jgi:hypothetical protein
VTLVAAAVCPHPPLLVPELAAGAAGELDGLRRACAGALAELAASRPDLLAVVGCGEQERDYGPGGRGDFSGYGARDAVFGEGECLPLPLAVGQYLLVRAGWPAPTSLYSVRCDAAPGHCAEVGGRLAAAAPRVALLAMGDGTARLTERAPGYLDERAPGFRADARRALETADTAALARLDPDLCAELLAPGRAAWQVLAGAAAPGRWAARVRYDEAPYGVAYLVVTWRPAER